MAEVFGKPCVIDHLEARNEVNHALADHTNFNRDFGDRVPTQLSDGLARMATWVRERGVMSSPHFSDIELTRNLPPSWKKEP